jgi:hypothetical protein
MPRKVERNLIVDIDGDYEIEFEDITGDLPPEFEGKPIQWIANVNVRGARGRRYQISHREGRILVYFKNSKVARVPRQGLDVGDPPIGII